MRRSVVWFFVRPNVRAGPDPTDGRLAGAAFEALHGRAGQVRGWWGTP